MHISLDHGKATGDLSWEHVLGGEPDDVVMNDGFAGRILGG